MRAAFGQAALALALCACRPAPRGAVPSDQRPIDGCVYTVDEQSALPARLEISAHCSGRGISGFSATNAASLPFIEIRESSQPLLTEPDGWHFATPLRDARVRYLVDLEAMAHRSQRFDTAERIGQSMLAPASSYLLEPEPLDVGVPIQMNVRVPAGEDFASGLIAAGPDSRRSFRLQSHEVSVATYSIFGHFRRAALRVGASSIDVVTADGPLAVTPASLNGWVARSAGAVADFYGRFPTPHALVLAIPTPHRNQVLFGKVLPQSSPAVALLIGEQANEVALHDDWILVHELFHIGFPSFQDEAKWLDEGSATYYEPIIRARARNLTELQVWTELAHDMPRGLPAIEHEGLEHPSDFRSIYWGGAIACLLADVAARRASHGAFGLEAGFRAVLAAGGNATEVWSLAQVTNVIDRALGAPILRSIVDRYANSGAPVGLPALLAQLGVVQSENGLVTLDDHAELATLRHQITFGH